MLDTIHLPRSTVHLLCTREAGQRHCISGPLSGSQVRVTHGKLWKKTRGRRRKRLGHGFISSPCCGVTSAVSFCQRSQPLTDTSLHQLRQGFSAVFFFSIIILLRRLFKHFSPNPLSFPIIETVIPQIHCRCVSMCCVCVRAS